MCRPKRVVLYLERWRHTEACRWTEHLHGKGQTPIHQFPRRKSVTTSRRGQKSVVSCLFAISITTCCQFVTDMLATRRTILPSWQQVGNFSVYEETCLMDFGHYRGYRMMEHRLTSPTDDWRLCTLLSSDCTVSKCERNISFLPRDALVHSAVLRLLSSVRLSVRM